MLQEFRKYGPAFISSDKLFWEYSAFINTVYTVLCRIKENILAWHGVVRCSGNRVCVSVFFLPLRKHGMFVCFWSNSPPMGQALLIHEVSRSHTTTQHSR